MPRRYRIPRHRRSIGSIAKKPFKVGKSILTLRAFGVRWDRRRARHANSWTRRHRAY